MAKGNSTAESPQEAGAAAVAGDAGHQLAADWVDTETLRIQRSFGILQVAKILATAEDRLVSTERELIGAVRRTIRITEAMIVLVRSATSTAQTLMQPLKIHCGAKCRENIECVCDRVAVAKCLVKVVESLNQTAGHMNDATDHMIVLSNSLVPQEDIIKEDCVSYLLARVEAAQTAIGNLVEVANHLQFTVDSLPGIVSELRVGSTNISIDEKESALGDLQAMLTSAMSAVEQLRNTMVTLRDSVLFLLGIVHQLGELGELEEDEDAVAALAEQLECPVCYQFPLPPAVWVCCNGHVVCSTCRGSLVTCPTCRGPLGSKPAALLSAWAGALPARCPGCGERVALRDWNQHQSACRRGRPTPNSARGCRRTPPVAGVQRRRSWSAGDQVVINGKFYRRGNGILEEDPKETCPVIVTSPEPPAAGAGEEGGPAAEERPAAEDVPRRSKSKAIKVKKKKRRSCTLL